MSAKPWKSLKTHKGPASTIPSLLGRLADAAGDVRDSGRRGLNTLLIAEGKWCSACLQVLGELVDRALRVDHPERAWCPRLATNLLTAGHHGWLTTGLDPQSERFKQLMARGAAAAP